MLSKITNLIFTKPAEQKSLKNFFDYSSFEKKRIVKEATIGANKLQSELVDRYRMSVGQ